MNPCIPRMAALAFALLPISVAAEPITLKLAFFSSDRHATYLSAVKPFVDAINNESDGLLKVDVYFSGKLAPDLARQPQLVRDGVADIAFIVPGYSPQLFPDSAILELPGLFRDSHEASLTYTRLVANHALAGYDDFFVIGAVGTQPETIHTRKRLTAIADLAGQTMRVNNDSAATALTRLGATPKLLPLTEIANAISAGIVDGAVVQSAQLFDSGIARLTTNHYLLGVGAAPLALVMSRKVFDKLPERARAFIQKRSGEWMALRYSEISDALSRQAIEQLRADPRRTVTSPAAADLEVARRTFAGVVEQWASASPRNRELLTLVEAELAKIRRGQ